MKRILIVDDEAFLLQGLASCLRGPGRDVVMAETGAAALAEIAGSEYQLCFLDIFLPDMDGTEVLEKIIDISPKTKVVIMTAGIVDGRMKESIEKNAFMFITKPFDLLQIRMIIKRVLDDNESGD